jgi:hypothetical protein
MSEMHNRNAAPSEFGVRLERVNTEKTRKDPGSDTVYHVYFELSGYPPPEWRAIFAREWTALSPTEVGSIDGNFLVLHCQLSEVGTTQLPILKKAVDATNAAYKAYVQKEATALEGREDVWKKERNDVEAMAAPLRFS